MNWLNKWTATAVVGTSYLHRKTLVVYPLLFNKHTPGVINLTNNTVFQTLSHVGHSRKKRSPQVWESKIRTKHYELCMRQQLLHQWKRDRYSRKVWMYDAKNWTISKDSESLHNQIRNQQRWGYYVHNQQQQHQIAHVTENSFNYVLSIRKTPFALAASAISCTSAKQSAAGFSTQTCFPFAIAASVRALWDIVIVPMYTISTLGSLNTSS